MTVLAINNAGPATVVTANVSTLTPSMCVRSIVIIMTYIVFMIICHLYCIHTVIQQLSTQNMYNYDVTEFDRTAA